MNTVLLDTNAYTKFTLGDRKITKLLGSIDLVYISTIVFGELMSGFENGNRINENLKRLNEFTSENQVKTIVISKNTARIYGKLFVELSKKGTPIPTNDIWIAAHVLETGSTLVTYDKHFLDIPNLKVWDGINN